MSLKRKIAITGGLFFLLSLLLICLLTGAYFYLPFYLETRIIPRLAADAGISDFAVSLRNIGFYGADLADLRLGPQKNPALVIRSVQVDYSPGSLYKRKIDKITLSGIDLYAELANGQFKLRGIDMNRIAAAQAQHKTAAPSNGPSPPVILARLQVRDSQIIIGYNDQIFRIPFDLNIVPQDSDYNVLEVGAAFYPRGEKITAALKVDRPQHRAAFTIDSAALNLVRFADITGRMEDLMLSGEMALQAKAQVLWAPLRLAAINASLTLQHAKIKVGEIQLQNALAAEGEAVPFRLDLTGKGDTEWQFSSSRISMAAPIPVTLAGIDGTVQRKAATLESSGSFSAVLNSSAPTGQNRAAVKIQDQTPLQGRFFIIYHQSGNWQLDVSNQQSAVSAGGAVCLTVEPYTITSSVPEFNFSAAAKSGNIDAAYSLTVPAVQIASGSESINIPKLLLKGTAQSEKSPSASAEVRLDLQASNTAVKLQDGVVKIPKIGITGKLNRDDVRQITLGGQVNFSGADGRFTHSGVQVAGAQGKIPFQWPVDGKNPKGSVSVANLKYKGRQLGRVSSQIRQTATGFAFEGRHQSALLPGMKVNFSGESRLFDAASSGSNLRVELSRPDSAPEIDLEKIFPEAKGFRIKGKFDLNGDFAMDGRGFSGTLQADLNDFRLFSMPNKLALEGIRMSLNFPEFPKIRSAPGQVLEFRKFSLGNLITEKGRVDFQIESARSVLIEKMRFLWCEGGVETQAMRLSPGVEDYRITFYCDRLNLAKVLEQFGAANAEGRGTVNGRIPLQYTNGKISFDDGFLFSTPGDGGKIRLTGTDILTAGVPPNTPQFVQMELAREALKDYDYTWAKLNITSQGEELLLQMQMDGKPAKTLPFVYRKDIGGFIKVEADAKGSTFQGIRLDVNFRLPLNKLMHYKGLINMIQ